VFAPTALLIAHTGKMARAEVINITLLGRIPSKKNSKMIVCRGRRPMLLPSEKHREWHIDASNQLRKQKVPRNKIEKFDVHVWFYAPDIRKADASNKWESVGDLLVDNEIIKDDSWWNIQELCIHTVELDRENPRVELELTEVL